MGALDQPGGQDGEAGGARSRSPYGGTLDEPNGEPAQGAVRKVRQRVIAGGLFLLLLAITLPPLFGWQSENQQKALSLANMRRVANGCLYYAQDWDEHMPPPSRQSENGAQVGWPRLVRPYVLLDEAFSNPSNPVKPFESGLRDATSGRPIDTSYALNRRFWNEFSVGPFPVGNLEIPEQTVLLVEAGRMAVDPRHPRPAGGAAAGIATDLYGDTTDRIRGSSPYPSAHGGQFGIVAADGHGIMTRVLYYESRDGPHDRVLGRIGDNIYDWNGGHANGETDRPARE